MSYSELIKLLYREIQPEREIEKLTETFLCKYILPDVDGEYLIYHLVYGWCTYGYTVKDRWGYDDEVKRRDGTTYNKVIKWGSLDFLDDNKRKNNESCNERSTILISEGNAG